MINIYSTDKNGYEELSNILHGPFVGQVRNDFFTWKTVEHYYQWRKAVFAKSPYIADQIFHAKTGWDARRLATTVRFEAGEREKWEDINVKLMRDILFLAFKQNEKQRNLLLSTGTAHLTHKHPYIKLGKWEFEFPRILMKVREFYQNQNAV